MNVRSQVPPTQEPRLAPSNERRRVYGDLTIDDAVSEAIAQHVRSGALDTETSEELAVSAIAFEFRLTDRQAWSLWLGYAATAQPQ